MAIHYISELHLYSVHGSRDVPAGSPAFFGMEPKLPSDDVSHALFHFSQLDFPQNDPLPRLGHKQTSAPFLPVSPLHPTVLHDVLLAGVSSGASLQQR